MKTVTRPAEVAAGVYRITRGTGKSGVYLVSSGSSWVLIDAGWAHQGALIKGSAELLFGKDTPPAAILLTHLHPDHAGSAAELARAWSVPVYVHPDELPPPDGKLAYTDPLGRVIEPFARFLPAGEFGACLRIAAAFDPSAGVPGLPDWQCIPTPGHTPGHASYFRAADGVLITGDALLTVSARSLWGVLPGQHQVCGPPRISTWDWAAATKSIARLAALEPQVLAPGHGTAMTGTATPAALRAFSDRLAAGPEMAAGLLRPVDYSSRSRYRRPPETYARLQWLGPPIIAAGMAPRNVLVLEVPGRNTGVIHRTTLVRTDSDGGHYLVALAGESQWVRNVRAADGRVVIGPRRRRAARLVEVPPEQRAPVMRAYLQRSGRQPGSRAAASEARYYFGVSADPSLEELSQIAAYYPVFQIVDAHQPPGSDTPPPAGMLTACSRWPDKGPTPLAARLPGGKLEAGRCGPMTSAVRHSSAVTQSTPPRALLAIGNPVMRLLLRSPLHGLVDPSVLLLRVTGRRTGRRYDIPVNYAAVDGRLAVVTRARWRVNLRGGADVDVTLRGRPRLMHAELEEDPSSVAVAYQEIISNLGWRKASGRLGISGPGGQQPTVLELKGAARQYGWSVITLTPR